ncbi:MAG: single-stranded DNA-binding protein [Flavobacteriales bacterium]|nr:single-stranded DNA-binding protein [Flavobacteriales bacterium]
MIMAGINKVILVGNLGKDPEVRHLENGAVVANFPIATSEVYTDKNGQRVTQTEWHNVVLWRRNAEVAEKYLSKGRQVYIEGKLRTRNWTDREGNTRYTTEVVGDVLQLLGSRPDDNTGQRSDAAQGQGAQDANTGSAPKEPALAPGTPEDDLPF